MHEAWATKRRLEKKRAPNEGGAGIVDRAAKRADFTETDPPDRPSDEDGEEPLLQMTYPNGDEGGNDDKGGNDDEGGTAASLAASMDRTLFL